MYLTIYLDRGRLAGLARIVIQNRGRLARIVIIGPRSSRPHLIIIPRKNTLITTYIQTKSFFLLFFC